MEDLFAPNPVNASLISLPHFSAKNAMETMLNLDFANLMSAEDPWDSQAIQDHKVSPVLTVYLDPKAFPDKTVNQEKQVPSDHPDVKDPKEKLDPKVILESKVFPDLKDPLVLKDLEDVKANVVMLVPSDPLVPKDPLVKTDKVDPLVLVVPTDKMVFPEVSVHKDPWDLKVSKEFPESLVPVVFPDLRVKTVLVANLLFPSLCPQMLILVSSAVVIPNL